MATSLHGNRSAQKCKHPKIRRPPHRRLSRDLPDWAKSKYEVDEVTVAAPPSWLAAMPDCLSMPDGGEGSDYIGRMSLVVSERACVVKA